MAELEEDGNASPPAEPAYQLVDVHKSYNKGSSVVRALDGVDLEIARGELLAVRGPTGHGKTTLLQLLGGLEKASSGQLSFEGRELAKLSERELVELRARSFGFVFQTFNLLPTLTAAENVEAALVPLGVKGADRRRRAREALDALGLADRSDHLPAELSGGQQQRVAIARALVKDPSVVLADEPTGNLDEETRDEIVALLEELWRSRGLTIVLVTHDSQVAARAARRVTLRGGRLSEKTRSRR